MIRETERSRGLDHEVEVSPVLATRDPNLIDPVVATAPDVAGLAVPVFPEFNDEARAGNPGSAHNSGRIQAAGAREDRVGGPFLCRIRSREVDCHSRNSGPRMRISLVVFMVRPSFTSLFRSNLHLGFTQELPPHLYVKRRI